MKSTDVVVICSVIVAVASAVSAPALEVVFPGHGTYLAGVLTVAGLAAGAIIRVLTNKTGAPAQAIVDTAPAVPASTTVYNPVTTPVLGLNVTTTSQLPIAAPQKGAP
jgi:hypothetical protein